MKYLSVCSGIEAASVAWHPLGWEPVGFAEVEKFPSQVLAHRFPGVKNYGDMTKYKEWDIEPGTIDLLVGGTPCQAFSVAGLRKGLADPRGNLALTFLAMADHFKPEWIVWENVPGVLSSNGGRDFGSFLGALGQLGYGFAYRVLDAQYAGTCDLHRLGQGWDAVPQRRRRVFVVAHSSGDPRRCAEVLFEPESLRGDSPPSREAGQKTATDSRASASGGDLWDTVGALCADTHPGAYSGQDAYTGRIIPSLYESHPNDSQVTGSVEQYPTISARWGTGGGNTPLVADQDQIPFETTGLGDVRAGDTATTLRRNSGASGESQNAAYILVNPTQPDTARAYSIAPGRQGTPEKVDDIYVTEQDTSRTLDGTCADPERRQGGTLIVQPSLYESHPSDCRVTGPVEQCPTVSAKWGTGGNNTPLVTDGSIGFAENFNAIELTQTAPAMTTSGFSISQNAGGLGIIQREIWKSVTPYITGLISLNNVTSQNNIPLVTDGATHFRKSKRAQSVDDDETWVESEVTNTMNVFDQGDVRATDVVISFQSKLSFSSASRDVAPTMSTEDVLATTQPDASAFSWQCRGDMRGMVPSPTAQLQRCQIEAVMVQPTMHVRRLTPVECERLQGFPDGWTDIRPNGKDTPDSPRYKALGNSMAVPVMRWIGRRIDATTR